ncbi:Dynein light chain type 1 [Musa troglodytarum]|uniref:Dynein light chain type 1 n=1 Tax=Musa troglodytarum TaxID=320322 RepID=A0A9E7F7Z0_9LILI|nr:Dynein light chain type 1 [Musa troglodytarum]
MHCGNRFWLLCHPPLWLFRLLQHRKPIDLAVQGCSGS